MAMPYFGPVPQERTEVDGSWEMECRNIPLEEEYRLCFSVPHVSFLNLGW